MVPDYDDDDIIEDYEEISTDSPVRRVNSGQGGPVQRPSGSVRPSTTAMPALDGEQDEFAAPTKGKITRKSAKLIWIICIAVSVLGVGAVLVDMLVDPLGRHKKSAPVANDPVQQNTPRMPPRRQAQELTAHQKLAKEFGVKAHDHYKTAVGSRSYDFVRLAIKRMNETYNAANENRAQAAGWVDAWVAFYEAEYAIELYNHVNKIDTGIGKFKPVTDYRDLAQCEILDESELKDPEAQRVQGFFQAIDPEATKINRHRKDLLAFVVASNVPDNQELNGPILEAKERLKAARESRQFRQEDLDYVNREPRGDDEPIPYID